MKKTRNVILIFIIGLSLSCRSKHPKWDGGIINEFGEYHVSKKKYIIDVYSRDGLLNYSVKNIFGKRIILGPTYGTSTYQNWAMYFDKNNDLWIESSDIGTSLWKYVGPDEYKEIDLSKETQYLRQMPEELKKRDNR